MGTIKAMHPLGVHSHLYRGTPAAVAAAVRAAGLSCVQLTPNFPGLPFYDLDQITPARCRQASGPFVDEGLAVAALSSNAQLLDPDLDRRHRGILRLHRLLQHARDFGTTLVVADVGTPVDRPRQAWQELCLILEEALKATEAHGVRLLLKPGPLLASCADAAALRAAVPHPCLGFVLDVAGWLLGSSPAELAAHLERLVAAVGPHAPLAHASDLRWEAHGPVTPRAGRGIVDFRLVFSLLARVQPAAPVILAHARAEELPYAKTHLRRAEAASIQG